MPEFIAPDTLETLASLVRDLSQATSELGSALHALEASPAQSSALIPISPQDFVARVLLLDEQISRVRLLLPLCTTGIQINEGGRALSLSELVVETRSEFDSLARAQLEALIENAPE